MVKVKRSRQFFSNGLILTATSLLLRTMGVWWSAFVAEKIQADGMGLYTLIMSVYGLTVTIATSGVSLASTRMCSEAQSDAELTLSLRRCLIYGGIFGLAAGGALFLGAEAVAGGWLGDLRCTSSLRLLGISMPFVSLSCALNGYFSAIRKVSKSAAVQIFEQLFKMTVTAWALSFMLPGGIEYACIALVGGGTIAEIASFLMTLILYLIERKKAAVEPCEPLSPDHNRAVTKKLFGIALPVAAAAYLRSGLTTLEHILIPKGLRKNPATADSALASYGVLCGMAMPVIMLPTALLYSFCGLLIPELAEANAKKDVRRIGSVASRVLKLTLFYSIGCAGFIDCFAKELGYFIYNSADAGEFIRIMAPLIPVMYMDHAVDSMLKGLGEQLYSMKVNILDAAMCALLVFILCPKIGIYGYVVTIYVSEVINASLSLARLLKVTKFASKPVSWLLRPLICTLAAVLPVKLFFPTGSMGSFICNMVFCTVVYCFLWLLGEKKLQKSSDSG